MASRRDSLTPPERTHTEDPGAHELDSDSEDHFSDAQSIPDVARPLSPIPKTRVEKVDNEPSYGEVPGTEAYRLREGDAEPDEIAVIQQDDSTADAADKPAAVADSLPQLHVPTTVLEEAPDADGVKTPDGTKHEADPVPDLVVKADGTVEISADKIASVDEPIASPSSPRVPSSQEPGSAGAAADEAGDDDDDFGDDFDDFEEGGDADADDDDFGDFDDGFQEAPPAAAPLPSPTPATQQQQQQQPPPQAAAQPALAFPIPDFEGLDAESILQTVAPYLNGLFPPTDALPAPPPLSNSIFLSPRSESLWSQLVAPPPLQPPDWIRSRIRRLFLVSLGVPVDLDEILPASKQKKLVLPSLSVRSKSDSPRTSSDSRTAGGAGGGAGAGAGSAGGTSKNNLARLKQSDANGSNSSVDSQDKQSRQGARKRKGPPPPPDLDLVAGQQLCKTTDEALDGMTDEELAAHLAKLQALEVATKEVLEYWTKRTDEKIGDREAFEGVIESLVAHARKTRK